MNNQALLDAIGAFEPIEREALTLMLTRTSLDTMLACCKLGADKNIVLDIFGRLAELGLVKISASGMRITRLIDTEEVLSLLKETKKDE